MLIIRKACLDDAPLLSEMGYTSYIYHFAHLWHEQMELQNYLRQEYSLLSLQKNLQNNESCWFIAEDIDPIGFAKVSWHGSDEKGGLHGAMLSKLYLLPGKTDKGYGEKIFKELVVIAQDHGESFFWLEVLNTNPRAYRFYTRQGLIHLKDTVFSTASQQSTVHILGRKI